MRIVILSLLFFLSFSECGYSSQEIEESKEELDPYLWDFGKVGEGEVLEHTFVVKNESPVTLQIKRIHTSCGCTTSKAPEKKEIPPGESVDIQVKFNTRGYSGSKEQFVYIHTDQQDSPPIKLTLKADIHPALSPK